MTLQRASVLYPVNSTTVDTGTGIDIRLLDSAQAGATDNSQTITLTHTQDNTTRLFDPATAGSTATVLTYGYALRLAEDMTPDDDTLCNAFLPAQTITVDMRVAVNRSGGTYVSGTYAPEWRALIAAWNPTTNTVATISAVAVNSGTSWNYTPITGDLGTFKNISLSVPIADYEFVAGTILFLMLGVNSKTIPNPTLGTATWTYTLSVDDASTKLTFATNKSMRQLCRYELDSSGVGVAALGRRTVGKMLSVTAVGVASIQSYIRLAAKTATAVGVASIAKYVRIAAPKLATAVGVADIANYIRLAAKTAAGVGVASEDNYIRLAAKTAAGVGVAAFSKFVEAFRQFSVVAVGAAGFARSLIAVRAFSVVAVGVADIANYIRLAAKTATGVGMASINKMVLRTVSVTAVGVASIQRYVRLAAKTALAIGVAGFARSLIAVRAFAVVAVGVAVLFVRISQSILNRLAGGAVQIIRRLIIFDKT